MRATGVSAAMCIAALTVLMVGCAPAEPVLPEFTQQQLQDEIADAQRRAEEKLLGRYPEAVVPEAGFIRFIESNEWAVVKSECMTSRGFTATVSSDGGVEFAAIPGAQREAQALASYECDVAYPIHPRHRLPLTDEQKLALYRYFVDEIVPCLEREGFAPGEPPTWQSFNEGFERGSWLPYDVVDPTSMQEWERLNEVCPQYPG